MAWYHRQKGMTLVETIIYVALAAMIVMVATSMLIAMYRAFLILRFDRLINYGGEVAMERLVFESRRAVSVDLAGSNLDTHPGKLKLNTTTGAGTPTTIEFAIVGNQLRVTEGAGSSVVLLPTHASATTLIFRRLTTAHSEAVRIELTLLDDRSTSSPRLRTWRDTVILRNSLQ